MLVYCAMHGVHHEYVEQGLHTADLKSKFITLLQCGHFTNWQARQYLPKHYHSLLCSIYVQSFRFGPQPKKSLLCLMIFSRAHLLVLNTL